MEAKVSKLRVQAALIEAGTITVVKVRAKMNKNKVVYLYLCTTGASKLGTYTLIAQTHLFNQEVVENHFLQYTELFFAHKSLSSTIDRWGNDRQQNSREGN